MSWVRSLCNTHTHTHIIYPHFLLWCPNTAWTEETDDRKIIWLVQCWSTRANSGITKASEADFCQLAIVDVVFILRPSSWILPALAGFKNMDVVFNANILNQIWLPTVTTCCCVFSTSLIWAHSKCKPGWLSELCEHKVKKGGWARQRKSYMQSIQKCPLNVHTRAKCTFSHVVSRLPKGLFTHYSWLHPFFAPFAKMKWKPKHISFCFSCTSFSENLTISVRLRVGI